ncbi:MAG: helix-turn-helix domain-containing protein [Methanomassiliicoccales archaeon]
MKNAIWELKITQKDCPMIDTTKAFPSVFILMMNTEILNNSCQYLFSIIGSNERTSLAQAVKFLASHERVTEFNLISKSKNLAIANYTMKQTSMYSKASKIGFRLHPVLVARGTERWFFVTDSGKDIAKEYVEDEWTTLLEMRKMTQDEFSREYSSIFFKFYVSNMLRGFDPEDAKLMKDAIKEGFFDWPRGQSLTELSRKMNVPKSSMSYRIRRIVKRVTSAVYHDLSPFE